MPGFMQNLQGRRVYGSGSYAPTRGQVSAQGMQGYLRRELRGNNQGMYGGVSRFGRDGRSDTRSGAAKSALMRQGQFGNKWSGKEGVTGPGGINWKNRGRKPNAQARQAQQIQASLSEGPPVGSASAAPSPSATPSVTVNDAGILELPYSPAWGQDVMGGLEDTNAALLALQQQQQQQALQYEADKRQAGIDYTNIQRDTLNDNAARGVAFSSGYGVAVGRDANDYNNLTNALALANSQANAGFDFERTAIINAFKEQLRQGSLDYADSLVEGAGTFGYGQPGQGYRMKPNNRPKPTKKKTQPSKPNKPRSGFRPGR